MHGTTMIFLVVVPVWAGFANYLLPLMIGARDVAFPRLNAWSYWMYLFGGIALYASMLWSPPEAGWFSYVPLVAEAVLGDQRPGGVDLHGPPHRPELDHRRDQLHRHDPQHARARHGLGPHAAVRVDDPDLRVPDHRRAHVAGRDRDDAAAGPQLRHRVLRPGAGRARRCCGSTCSGSSATPRSTSSCCPRSASSPRSCRCSRASRSSATRRSPPPPPASPSWACSCGRTTCSRRRCRPSCSRSSCSRASSSPCPRA